MTGGVIGAASAEEMLSLIGGGWERSALFRYLREHHDRIVERQAGERMNWSALCGWFMASGLTNRRGGAPTPSCARKTWYRVRKLVASERQKAKEAAERKAQERAEEEVRQEARREAAREELARKAAENDAARRKYEETQRAAQWAREREQKRAAEMPASAAAADAARQGAAVRIGQVAPVFKMLEAAPLYGDAAKQPPPPPYVGPRPAGMPDNLPLEALVSLEASGRDEKGKIDFRNMPGLPRGSFFREEYEWARCCLSMIRAIPPAERSVPLMAMFNWLRSFPGIK